VKYFEKSE